MSTFEAAIIKPLGESVKNILIFDTETSGTNGFVKYALPPARCDYALQVSWLVYNVEMNQITRTFNSYVNVPESVEITEFISMLNHCTREKCDKGMRMIDILREFCKDYDKCDAIVAHNMSFDTKVMRTEIIRNWAELQKTYPMAINLFDPTYAESVNKSLFCTMKSTIALCKLPYPKKVGQPERKGPDNRSDMDKYKFPKLDELHKHLFPNDEELEGLHDAMVDVVVCLRCLMFLQYNHTLSSVKEIMQVIPSIDNVESI